MRKALLIVAMLLLATPVMATTTITAVKESQTRTPDGNEYATIVISYSGVAGVDANVRAFALDININNDGNNPNFQRIRDFNVGEANGTSKHLGYGIFPSRFRDFVNPLTPDACYADPNYNPTTAWNEPQTTDHNSGMGFPKMIVEMGTLYYGDANRPALSDMLFRFDINSWGNVGTFHLAVTPNALRGGVVNSDGNTITPVTSAGVDITFTNPGPPAPGSITYPATSDTGRYTVSWTASTGATSYVVERSRDGGVNWAADTNYVSGISYLSDEPNTTSNTYRVRACSTGCSGNTTGAAPCVVTYCYGDSVAGSSQWKLVGRPRCWCYPRQCHGDADGAQEGKSPNQYWVGVNDLTVLQKAWNKTAAQLYVAPEPNACADFDRASEGKSPNIVEVGVNDLTILQNNWSTKSPNYGNPPANCLPGNKAP
jgi:hypothetical protein